MIARPYQTQRKQHVQISHHRHHLCRRPWSLELPDAQELDRGREGRLLRRLRFGLRKLLRRLRLLRRRLRRLQVVRMLLRRRKLRQVIDAISPRLTLWSPGRFRLRKGGFRPGVQRRFYPARGLGQQIKARNAIPSGTVGPARNNAKRRACIPD